MVLSDYLVAQKRIERMTKEARRDAEWTALHKAIEAFERTSRFAGSTSGERRSGRFRVSAFISRIPMLLVLNVGEEGLGGEPYPELSKAAEEAKAPLVRLCAKVEEEISRLSPAEQAEFLREMGSPGVPGTSWSGGLSTRWSTSPSSRWGRTRCARGTSAGGPPPSARRGGSTPTWRRDSSARRSSLRGFPALRFDGEGQDGGKLRLEGKEYIVKDGEIFHVRFNV